MGSKRSGNYGHTGRRGKVGGSSSRKDGGLLGQCTVIALSFMEKANGAFSVVISHRDIASGRVRVPTIKDIENVHECASDVMKNLRVKHGVPSHPVTKEAVDLARNVGPDGFDKQVYTEGWEPVFFHAMLPNGKNPSAGIRIVLKSSNGGDPLLTKWTDAHIGGTAAGVIESLFQRVRAGNNHGVLATGKMEYFRRIRTAIRPLLGAQFKALETDKSSG